MSEREAWARGRLQRMQTRCPPAAELARLLSPAVLIEPALLRTMRLTLLPADGAWIESELWFGPLAKTHGGNGIQLEPAVRDLLRKELAQEWLDPARRMRLLDARAVMERVHATLSPALALEERVAWATVAGDLDEIDDELASAVKALLDRSRPGVAAWAQQAVARLPPTSFDTEAGQALLALVRRAQSTRPPQQAASLSASDTRPAQVLAELPTARVGVARRGPQVVLGTHGPDAGHSPFALPVPATEPQLVEVLSAAEDGRVSVQRVPLASGRQSTVIVGRGRVQLRNARDELFDVPGFAQWAGGDAHWWDLQVTPVGTAYGRALSLRLALGGGEPDITALIAEADAPDTGPSTEPPRRDIDLPWPPRLAARLPVPSAIAARLHALADLRLHLDERCESLPWEDLCLRWGAGGRLTRAATSRAASARAAGADRSALVTTAVDGVRITAPLAAAEFAVEAVAAGKREELLFTLYRKPWRLLHLDLGADDALRPDDIGQMRVLPELVVLLMRVPQRVADASLWGRTLAAMGVFAMVSGSAPDGDAAADRFLEVMYELLLAGSTIAEACVVARLETGHAFPDAPASAGFQLHGDGDYRLPARPTESPLQATHRVAADALNLRSAPGAGNTLVIGILARGTPVEVQSAAQAGPAQGEWVRIRVMLDNAVRHGFVASRFLEPVGDIAADETGETNQRRAVRAFEQRSVPQPGLYRIHPSPVPPTFELERESGAQRARPRLLLIHGMASSTSASFQGFWSEASRSNWQRLTSHYADRILCFEHHALSQSPIDNALALLEALPARVRLHVLSISDGGLIGELLCCAQRVDGPPFDSSALEPFATAERRKLSRIAELTREKAIRIDHFVRVACPARGTTYPLRAKQVLGAFARIAGKVGSLAGSLPLQLLDVIADPASVPGLQALDPAGPLIRLLNRAGVTVAGELSVVAGCFRADSLTERLAAGISGLLLDHDNDLLVPTESMFGGLARVQPARFVRFEGGGINHFSYFDHADVVRAIVDRLLGVPSTAHWQFAAGQRPLLIQIGDEGAAVTALQQRLEELGFGPVPIDGHFGPRTQGAVMRFQEVHRLTPDGVVGPRTLEALELWRSFGLERAPGGIGNDGSDAGFERTSRPPESGKGAS